MSGSRFRVPVEALEERTRVAVTQQPEMQAEPPSHELADLGLHPFGDGACSGVDGDGD